MTIPHQANPRPLLISLHLPKTAGSSLRTALQAHFGASFRGDYNDTPLNTPPLRRNLSALAGAARSAQAAAGLRPYPTACIHGHFMPLKYLPLSWPGPDARQPVAPGHPRRVQFITWLRDPVERLLSHYYYWQRNTIPRPLRRSTAASATITPATSPSTGVPSPCVPRPFRSEKPPASSSAL